MKKTTKPAAVAHHPARGRRYTEGQRSHALKLVASGVARNEVAKAIGATTESVRVWVKAARAKGTLAPAVKAKANTEPAPLYAAADAGQGLGTHETAAILELKKKHPSMGPAQLRVQLKRFKGWRLSIKAIARVLRKNGYQPVHRGGRPEGPEPTRFEAPRRNALWQADYAEVRVGPEKLYVLILLDDFSRFVVGHALADSPSSSVATETLKLAIARHGKPEAVRTDRGGAFVAFAKDTDFARFLEAELIDHVVGKPYHPQGGGKVEAAVGTLRRELWDVEHFADRERATSRLARFFDDYNERRAHMGIGGLTPADRFFGRADRVLAAVDAISRHRQGALAHYAPAGAPIDEVHANAPMEVLRLVIVDGVMQLHFCGARVTLGPIAS